MITINLLPEKWKPIPDCSDYAASSQGRIMRITSNNNNTYPGKLLKPANYKGYLYVTLYKAKKPKVCRVAGLITLSFLGPPPKGKEINHKNAIKADNKIQNLEYVTKKENAQHAASLGLLNFVKGQLNPNAKLTEQNVITIIKLRKLGWTLQKIGNRFNVYPARIGSICSGNTWNSVTGIK